MHLFYPLFNPTMHQICNILLSEINLIDVYDSQCKHVCFSLVQGVFTIQGVKMWTTESVIHAGGKILKMFSMIQHEIIHTLCTGLINSVWSHCGLIFRESVVWVNNNHRGGGGGALTLERGMGCDAVMTPFFQASRHSL